MATKSFRTALPPQTQFWLADQKVPLGFVLAVMFVAVLAGVALLPIGRTTHVAGWIERFGLTESETGSSVVAVVRLPDREITVPVSRAMRCTTGGRITLQEQQRLLGPVFIADWQGCSSAP